MKISEAVAFKLKVVGAGVENRVSVLDKSSPTVVAEHDPPVQGSGVCPRVTVVVNGA